MQDFEKLGVFYLGRPYDLEKNQPKDGLLLYDSKDLVTHAVCVGMTGSGETGLCISLLEEAAIDGIPSIVIDPKGDLGNLLLTFPELTAADFVPWINSEDAQKKGLTVDDFAKQESELWREGLADWGQDKARIKRLRDAADFRIFTPGSNAGFPVSILSSFQAPPAALREDAELLNERVSTTVTSLLGLLGVDADPIKSREHILLSTILRNAWASGTDLDLGALIQQIQSPSITRVGVMDLESFFPAKERFELAMLLNNLLAAPGFSSWLEGEPLDIQRILFTPEGKPRVAIFSIAHLNDAERMFFVSLMLNQILGWMRTQSGTTSLRAIFYMDEIFGYFPPVANPPSKLPLLTLLKQGRAFGLGVVLVTQNPVDLDYKGLSNTGTWFIGRLQTERDKARVMEGLEGVAAVAGQRFNRQKVEQTIAGLGKRIFLLNNVHEDENEIFQTRWAMSYLRGPLTRTQIKSLMDPVKAQPQQQGTAATTQSALEPVISKIQTKTVGSRPILPPEIAEQFIPLRSSAHGQELVYHPMVLAAGDVRFTDKKIDATESLARLSPITDDAIPVDWNHGQTIAVPISDLEASPEDGAQFADFPASAGNSQSYDGWKKDFANWLYRNRKLELLRSPSLGVSSKAGETEAEFRIRLQQAAREKRDEKVEQLRQKYAPKIASLEDRRRRAAQTKEREAEQASSQKVQTAISFGATILSSFLGRKMVGMSTLGRATTAARGVGRSMKESQDVTRAQETLEVTEQRLESLNEEFRQETEALDQSFDPQKEELETVTIKPTKANVTVRLLALAWVPYWHDSQGNVTPAWQ